jgi:hypothetical protein
MNVQHATVTSHTTDRHAAVKAALAKDAKHYADRMTAALAAGDQAEAERCAQFAAGSTVLAINLGITRRELQSAMAVYAAGTR